MIEDFTSKSNYPVLAANANAFAASHISHHLLALWWLGAPAPIIQAAYDHETKMQRPITYGATKGMEPITEANFPDHIGDPK